ncbi:hypothetical protein [Micromonospora sp. Llam0]|uniref:hypothetical protein n=1 Tax=Micromonospora sp. Llam0 TaxID=2485143 RepID=UPI00131535B8|nr:hypothetical protein [Micromonospora sp. Llam0]
MMAMPSLRSSPDPEVRRSVVVDRVARRHDRLRSSPDPEVRRSGPHDASIL